MSRIDEKGASRDVKNDQLLRRLALNDEAAVHDAVAADGIGRLDARTAALVRLAALLATGAATSSCRVTVEAARAAGVTEDELVGVLVAIAPAVGQSRVVTAAPRLALAIDYDVEDLDTPWDEAP